ncbi:MAG: ATP-binding protein [Leptolyngbyaceae cyanobacterium]
MMLKWSTLDITTKFNVAFGGFFALLLLVSSASYLSLLIVRRQIEASIVTSIEIQRHVLEMNAALQAARVNERDFFLRYPEVGFATAQQNYAAEAVGHIAEVIRLSQSLEALLQSSHVSNALQKSNIDLTRYFLLAERYQNTFLDAVDLATALAGDDDGLWGKVEDTTEQLRTELFILDQPTLMTRYYEMRQFEKDYRLTRQRGSLQTAFNIVFQLRRTIDGQPNIEPRTRDNIERLLVDYETTLKQVEELDRSIRGSFRDFELQASQVDPVSSELIQLSKAEVARAKTQISQTSQIANICLGITVVVGMVLAGAIARLLTHSITKRVIQLNEAVESLESGNLDTRASLDTNVDDPDELERLARSFNEMAHQLQMSFHQLEMANDELEQRVRDRTADLSKALEQLQSAQAQLIQTEKMSSLGQMVAGVAHEINNPVSFIYGNISPAFQYIDELIDLIDLYQLHYPSPHPEIRSYVETIELDFVQQDLKHLLVSMKEGAVRIREIVKSLRTFSRLDEAEFKCADIHAGLDSTLMLLQNRLKYINQKHSITVTRHYEDLPMVMCYPGQLNQVFMNILNNAIDALEQSSSHPQYPISPDNPSSSYSESHNFGDHDHRLSHPCEQYIRIQTQVIDQDSILVQIIDNGPGMVERVRERLFDPFFTTKPVGKGTGLGLSISYQIIVERHQGKLWCESSLGEGTTFNIQIPIVQSS